jgi:hypothetical protein
MIAFVPDPGFTATFLILALPGQPVIKEDLMDGIVRYMDAMFVFDYLLEASCAQILIFVDFQNQINLVFIKHSLLPSGFLYGQQLVIFSPVDPYAFNCGLANLPLPCDPLCAIVIDLISNYAFDLSHS